MSTTTISIALVVGIIIIVCIMAIVQARHAARVRRLARIQLLSTQNKQIRSALSSFARSLLSPQLKDFLFQILIANYKQILALNPDNPDYVKSDLAQAVTERQESKNQKEASSTGLTELSQVNSARSTLKSIYDLIKASYENKRIDSKIAEKLLLEVEDKMLSSAVDFYSLKGVDALANKRFKEAMSSWSKVSDVLNASKNKAQYRQEIIDAQAHVKDVQKKWREYNAATNEKNAELAEEMDSFLTKQDDWKKRQDYD